MDWQLGIKRRGDLRNHCKKFAILSGHKMRCPSSRDAILSIYNTVMIIVVNEGVKKPEHFTVRLKGQIVV